MDSVETKRHIMGFMYGERLKSFLIVADQLLNVLADLDEEERAGGIMAFSLASVARQVFINYWMGCQRLFTLRNMRALDFLAHPLGNGAHGVHVTDNSEPRYKVSLTGHT
jgi:hypothetical protein